MKLDLLQEFKGPEGKGIQIGESKPGRLKDAIMFAANLADAKGADAYQIGKLAYQAGKQESLELDLEELKKLKDLLGKLPSTYLVFESWEMINVSLENKG